mgnify:CR=1 FL=1
MWTTIKTYSSVKEFIDDLENMVATYRRELGKSLRELEELRARYESYEALRKVLSKVVGTKVEDLASLSSIKLGILHPLKEEVDALEEAVEDLNRKVMTIETLRGEIMKFKELLEIEGVRVEVVIINGIPRTILVKIK